jgi:nucleotide-binding universal stress UspA family protein
MFKNILLIYYGVPSYRNALGIALDIAQTYHSKLSVFALDNRHYQIDCENLPDQSHFQALKDIKKYVQQYGLDIDIITACGDLGVSVTNYVEKERYDLVVIGTRPIHGKSGTVLTNAVDNLVHLLKCPVIVVKEKVLAACAV